MAKFLGSIFEAVKQVQINNPSTDNALKVTQTGDAGSSSSTGGALNINNTSNVGSALVAYTAQGSSAGSLAQFTVNNAAFAHSGVFISYNGTANALNVSNTSSDSGSGAVNFGSSNPNESTVKITGVETSKGTIKITHTGTGSDTNASAISISLAGSGTAAQGIFIDTASGTTGKLLNLRDSGSEKLVLTASRLWLNTRSHQQIPNSAPTDGDLANSQMSIWLDETSSVLKARTKNSSGTLRTYQLADSTDIQTFSSAGSSTYTVPVGAKTVECVIVGAGGGGGAGRRGAAGSVRTGGAGGGSGSFTHAVMPVADLPSSFNVTIGAGGTAGTAASSNDADGGAGGNGGATFIGAATNSALLRAGPGNGGAGGTTGAATGGGGGTGQFAGQGGAASSATGAAGTQGSAQAATASGASGGGLTTGNATSAGGAGSMPNLRSGVTPATAGTAGGGNGGNGPTAIAYVGAGSGAGGGSATSGVGGTGGNGIRGAGGGGGGASTNGSNSGAGGAGGDGFIALIAHF